MAKTITLYHGTAASRLDSIRRNGILGAGSEQAAGNWDGKLAAREGLVYLTDAYPLYFAYAATGDDEDLAIVEVSVPVSSLYPDEDYMGWSSALAMYGEEYTRDQLVELTEQCQPREFQKYWRKSLRLTGRLAADPIPPEMIVRDLVIPWDNRLLGMGADPILKSEYYPAHRDGYQKWLGIIMDDGIDVAYQRFDDHNRMVGEWLKEQGYDSTGMREDEDE